MESVKKLIEATPVICKSLDSAAKDIEKLIEYSTQITEALISSLDYVASLEGDVVELKDQLLECKSPLKKSHAAANLVVSRLEKALQYGDITDDNDYKQAIIESVNTGKTNTYDVYIKQLGNYFEQCGKCYKDYEEYHKEAKEACKEGRKICEKKKEEAGGGGRMSTGGRAAMIGGSVVGAAGVAGLATVAGLFTFGIGAPVVLGIAGAAAGVGATGGGAAAVAGKLTANAGDRYVKVEEGFATFLEGFDGIKKTSISLEVSVFKLAKVKEGLVMNTESVVSAYELDQGEKIKFGFMRSFDILLKALHSTREKMSIYTESMNEVNQQFEKID